MQVQGAGHAQDTAFRTLYQEAVEELLGDPGNKQCPCKAGGRMYTPCICPHQAVPRALRVLALQGERHASAVHVRLWLLLGICTTCSLLSWSKGQGLRVWSLRWRHLHPGQHLAPMGSLPATDSHDECLGRTKSIMLCTAGPILASEAASQAGQHLTANEHPHATP